VSTSVNTHAGASSAFAAAAATADPVQVTYGGHATVLVELDGVRLLTDPVLRQYVLHLRRIAGAARAPAGLDAILVSHGHYDHFDLPTLRHFDRSTPVVVPRGLGGYLRRFERVVELEAGDELSVGAIRLRATYAAHAGGRPPFTRRAKALGYAMLGSRRVFFAGDTDLFPEMDGLVPDLDLALLPIWGWGPSLGPGHLDPERAAEALTLLRPRVVVPIHWGTFAPLHKGSSAGFLRAPVEQFLRAAEARAPEVEVRVLEPGEALELS
jgi:L-ascorbate metabolism protein UlaG (beta-lactamase superfamily)